MNQEPETSSGSISQRLGVTAEPVGPMDKVGVSRSVREGVVPLNGLRHHPTQSTSGWFVWAGEELSEEPDFFEPLHSEHLAEWRPEVLPYLELPPGWRFLLAPGHEDVWFDSTLLSPEG